MDDPKLQPSNSTDKQMNLQEARAVLWLRSNHRPLGELLDEGYLNPSRLEWAATKAYDPKLKQAAGVLLDALKRAPVAVGGLAGGPMPTARPSAKDFSASSLPIGIPIGAPLEQARATAWPFAPYKGQPMGPLAETQQISLKDLGYAIDNAWDQRVRQAATALLLLRLKQVVQEPPRAGGPLQVITGGQSFAQHQQYRLTLAQGCLMGAFLGGSIVGFIWSVVAQRSAQSPSSPPSILTTPQRVALLALALLVVLAVIGLTVYLLDRVVKGLDRQIDHHRQGQAGEDRVAEIARQSLDGHWHLFRNIVLPGRTRADLDGVLVGPAGVWVLEIKALTGEYRNTGDRWEYKRGSRWKPIRANPSRQAEANAIRLANFLKADDLKQWVTPVVVWANPESPLTVVNPAANVWTLDRLPDELGNLWRGQPIPDAKRDAIANKLALLCQQSRQAEAAHRP